MPITEKTIKLYTYDCLPTEKAKANAREWWISVNDDWYRSVYEDAEQAGIKIKSFDTPRGHIDIELENGATETAEYILRNHGKDCDTYKAAETWEKAIDALPEMPEPFDWSNPAHQEIERQLCEGNDAIEGEFIQALEKAYMKMLQAEDEYQSSEEAIAETMEDNQYTFNEQGRREDA